MKKISRVLLAFAVMIIMTSNQLCFAADETVFTDSEVNAIADKFNVEVLDSKDLDLDSLKSNEHVVNVKNLEELNDVLSQDDFKYEEIQNEDRNVYLEDMKIRNKRSSSSTKSITLNEYINQADELVLKASVRAKYSTSGNQKKWVSVDSYSLKEHSNKQWLVLSKVKRVSANISSSSKIKFSYKCQLDQYLIIPIPGVDKVIKKKVGSQDVSGNVYFYTSSI
ncbi:hypothetical protein [Tepidibacter aestuarii]|uniref:hypothetical protein n=1 Tax=Tepidibacter aestuarii TaxID=2925782 RepID=UPI0020BE90C0|nr:hypothetical protein [Tepidibacter aestuarii]CAH2214827.1 exported protein of unknown function [Tepidibacter aestuarii]